MKMRTLGRHHWALKKLADGEEHEHNIFRPVTAWSSKFLEKLLIRGLVRRTSRNVKERAKYVITELGLQALRKLEEAQKFEDIDKEQVLSYFNKGTDEEFGIALGHGGIAKRRYKWVEVEVKIDEQWKQHFEGVTW